MDVFPKGACWKSWTENITWDCDIKFKVIDSFKDAADPFDSFEGNQEFRYGRAFKIGGSFDFDHRGSIEIPKRELVNGLPPNLG